MAVNIFDKYGIKEVANVYFEALETDAASNVYAGDIVLFLDTLKVSTIETTAENVSAQGGWGNPRLITWDYGKEINLTLEDALLSLESLRFMLGGAVHQADSQDKVIVRYTEQVVAKENGVIPLPVDHLTNKPFGTITASTEHPIRFINMTTGTRTQVTTGNYDGKAILTFKNPAMGVSTPAPAAEGDVIRVFWEEEVDGTQNAKADAVEVTISPSTFPGTYRVVGDTFMRSEKTGKDEAFQFVIGKAKVLSEVTITLEAEGDPSTFEMQLQVLRSENEKGQNEMMKLIRYTNKFTDTESSDDDYGSLTAGSGT